MNKNKKCTKVKLDKVGAMMRLSQFRYKRDRGVGHKRKESRYYLCDECDAYHLTSQA